MGGAADGGWRLPAEVGGARVPAGVGDAQTSMGRMGASQARQGHGRRALGVEEAAQEARLRARPAQGRPTTARLKCASAGGRPRTQAAGNCVMSCGRPSHGPSGPVGPTFRTCQRR